MHPLPITPRPLPPPAVLQAAAVKEQAARAAKLATEQLEARRAQAAAADKAHTKSEESAERRHADALKAMKMAGACDAAERRQRVMPSLVCVC